MFYWAPSSSRLVPQAFWLPVLNVRYTLLYCVFCTRAVLVCFPFVFLPTGRLLCIYALWILGLCPSSPHITECGRIVSSQFVANCMSRLFGCRVDRLASVPLWDYHVWSHDILRSCCIAIGSRFWHVMDHTRSDTMDLWWCLTTARAKSPLHTYLTVICTIMATYLCDSCMIYFDLKFVIRFVVTCVRFLNILYYCCASMLPPHWCLLCINRMLPLVSVWRNWGRCALRSISTLTLFRLPLSTTHTILCILLLFILLYRS